MSLFDILQGDCANEVETEQIVADADVSSLTSGSSKLGFVGLQHQILINEYINIWI